MWNGIDVSSHQGEIDWPQVKASGMSFAMIRAGYGNDVSQKDARFDANVRGALAAGLDVGVYWFSYAVSEDDAKKEAAVCRQVLAPYRGRLRYPVAWDYEGASREYSRRQGVEATPVLINAMADAFLSAMRDDGWKTALYMNNDFRRNVFSAQTLAAWDIWLADYTGGPCAPCAVRQTSDAGCVPGVCGAVDIDVCFAAYSGPEDGVAFDTTELTMEPGAVYTLKTTSAATPVLTPGTTGVVRLLPHYRSGNDDFWYLVAVGKPGDGVGIYCAGRRRLVVNIR